MKKLFKGKTVYIIGGGPSVTQEDVNMLRHEECIVVNTSFYIAPWARVMFFMDDRFFKQHGSRFHKFHGDVIYHTSALSEELVRMYGADDRMRALDVYDEPFVAKGSGIGACGNSGLRAINLAYLLGAKKIVLLGFDANPHAPANWHTDTQLAHASSADRQVMSDNAVRDAKVIFDELCKLKLSNNYIFNTCKDSFIKDFQYVSLNELLKNSICDSAD